MNEKLSNFKIYRGFESLFLRGKTSLTLLGVIHTAKLTIPVTNLSNGVYTIQIKDNNYKQTIKKFIKQ